MLYAHWASLMSKRVLQSMFCISFRNLDTFFFLMSRVNFGDTGWVSFTVLMLPTMWRMAKWSDILVHNMPCICPDDTSILSERMWSISVAEEEVTLVGFVIRGYTLWEYMVSKNSEVGLCTSCLKRSNHLVDKTICSLFEQKLEYLTTSH